MSHDITHDYPWKAAWPVGLDFDIPPIDTTIYENLLASALKYPKKPALVFYDSVTTYGELHAAVEAVAGYLQTYCDVKPGDRVGIYSQNCPQYVVAYYGILRAGGIVVPINPMNKTAEMQATLNNAGIVTLFCSQDIVDQLEPLFKKEIISHAILIRYADFLKTKTDLFIPEFLTQEIPSLPKNIEMWDFMMAKDLKPSVYNRTANDLAVFPYTSGSTGVGKACMHTNATTLHATRSIYDWFGIKESDIMLSVAPLFHVVGMQASMNVSIECGCTLLLIPRWDRETVAQLIQRYHVSVWPAVPTMVIDLLNLPNLGDYDLSSIWLMFGGGMSLPKAVAKNLFDLCGIRFLEGYGLSETMAPATANPVHKPKSQCGGIPVFNTEVLIVDRDTLQPLPQGEVGEIVIAGPQIMLGYWQNDEANKDAFMEYNQKKFLRTGDIGRFDEDGYVFILDRIKRMINVSGFKVWPAEVEAKLYQHPDIDEVCIIASPDSKSGEAVKAVVVLKPSARGNVTENELITWSRTVMAVYKAPRIVEFVSALEKSGSGKVLWKKMQDREKSQVTGGVA